MASYKKKTILPALLTPNTGFVSKIKEIKALQVGLSTLENPFLQIGVPLLLIAGFLLVFLHNLSPSVYSGDVGDLVTSASVGGVAHPPGYPLFTFLGFLFTHQTLFHASPAFLVGLISAVFGAIGIGCFYYLSLLLSKSRLVSILMSCVLGFSFLYWFYAEIAEVFALNVFFAILLFLLAILYRQTKKIRVFYLFFLSLGLSLTNHQTILLLVPSLLLLIIPTAFSFVRKHPLSVLYALCSMLLGFTPYAYVWIASSHHPIINWDNVHNVSSFLYLILRKDYGTFQAGIFQTISFSQRLVTLQVFIQYLFVQLTIPVIALSLLGFWRLFLKDKILCIALLLAFVLAGPAFLVYAGFPLTSGFVLGTYERFILLPLTIFIIPASVGLVWFSNFLASFLPKRNYPLFFQLVFFLIPLMLFIYNFPKTNLSQFYLGDNLAKDFLLPLPKHAILLISGDTQIFNTWYLHYALHVRPDVLVYNLGATQTQDNVISPQLSGIPQSKQTDKIISILQEEQATRPVFSNTKLQHKNGPKILWIPVGLSYQMIQPSQLPSQEQYKSQTRKLWKMLHYPTKADLQKEVFHNLSTAELPTTYADMLVAAGAFAYAQYKDSDTALMLYDFAKTIAPDDAKIYADQAVISMGIAGSCKQTVSDLSTAITLNPYQEGIYFLLYNISLSCFKQHSFADSISKEYSQVFQKDFQKEYKKSGINKTLYE